MPVTLWCMQRSGIGRSAVVTVLALLLVAAGATACENESPRPPDTGLDYAALGDSFTAAPWLPKSSTDGCFRSSHNYPHQVAEALTEAELIDVSCGGATTEDILQSQDRGALVHPPQLEAVSADTDVVTLQMGANDLKFASLTFVNCVQFAAFSGPRGAPCEDEYGQRIPRLLAQTEDRLVEVLGAIAERAPEARILLIGYPRVLPESGGCRKRLPLAKGDVDFVRESYEQLNQTIRAAARAADVEYVDVEAASEGHDICSAEPWINGKRKDRKTKAAPFHPTPAEQEAVAELVLDLL